MKKIVSITLIALIFASCLSFSVSADSKVHIRIEGKEQTFFAGDVSFSQESTVYDVVKAVSDSQENVDVTFVDSGWGAYISEINGDKETTEYDYDTDGETVTATYYVGWMFAVDNQNSSVGVSSYNLKGGEDIVLYYADMGAQVPVADFSEKGKIKLTSYDYDWVSDNMAWKPVSGAAVTLDSKELISDENGLVTYNPDDFEGFVNVRISKNDSHGYPLVCRFPSNYGFDMNEFDDDYVPAVNPVTLIYRNYLYVKGSYNIEISTRESVKFTSSNSKVAAVSSSGKITAKKAGTATITAKAGNVTAKYIINVYNPFLSVKSKTLKKGKSFTLKVTGAVDVRFSSSKKSVATVNSSGKVTAKKKGTAFINVKANGVALKCKVTVK